MQFIIRESDRCVVQDVCLRILGVIEHEEPASEIKDLVDAESDHVAAAHQVEVVPHFDPEAVEEGNCSDGWVVVEGH